MSNYYLDASNIFKDNCLILVTFISLVMGWRVKSPEWEKLGLFCDSFGLKLSFHMTSLINVQLRTFSCWKKNSTKIFLRKWIKPRSKSRFNEECWLSKITTGMQHFIPGVFLYFQFVLQSFSLSFQIIREWSKESSVAIYCYSNFQSWCNSCRAV